MIARKFNQMLSTLALGCAALAPMTAASAATIEVDKDIPEYEKVSGVSGNLSSIGSDTLLNLMSLWQEGFLKNYPNVLIQVEGKGSSTAPPALAEGTAQLGPMSRPMKDEEIEEFEKKHGYKPTKIAVALDSLAVYVNKDNPIDELSLPEVDAIFSKTLKGGHDKNIETWGDAGLTGDWSNKPLSLYGRNSASGTYGFFKEKALFKGDYKDSVKEQPGSSAVVNGVTNDLAGVGYSGIGYKTSDVKAIALSKEEGKEAYEATYENVLEGKYPLGRALLIYVAKEPNKPLDPLVKEFIVFVLSKEGQEVVVKDGYLPLTAGMVEKQIEMLD